MLDFEQLSGATSFKLLAQPFLVTATEQFFGCKVSYSAAPLKWVHKELGIDLTLNPRRGVYQLSDSSALLLGRVLDKRNVIAAFSLRITNAHLTGLTYLLNVYEAALALSLSRSYRFGFRDRPQQFAEDLLELAVAKYFSKGYYDYRKFLFLIDLFHKLSTSTFEGRHFTSGLILTRSHYAFAEKADHSRAGRLFALHSGKQLAPTRDIEKRFWYLADGQTSYYLCDRLLRVNELFVLWNPRQSLASFVDDYSLADTVRGGDALFRVVSQSELSITGSGGIDFNYKEGRWHVRNFGQIATSVREFLGVDAAFVQALLYFVFYLSRRRLSSILWVPADPNRLDELLLTRNQLAAEPLSILDERHTQTLLRVLSSDGASVIGTDGSLISFGSIVDIAKVKIAGVKGTGESVAALLAQNGLSVKISQDGSVKLYLGSQKPTIFI